VPFHSDALGYNSEVCAFACFAFALLVVDALLVIVPASALFGAVRAVALPLLALACLCLLMCGVFNF